MGQSARALAAISAAISWPRSPARRRAKGSRNSGFCRSVSCARIAATHRAVSVMSRIKGKRSWASMAVPYHPLRSLAISRPCHAGQDTCHAWSGVAEALTVPIGKHGWAWTILGLAGAIALTEVAVLRIWERLEERYPLTSFERSRDAEQMVSLRSYAARRRLGSFLPPGDAQLSIREALLQSVLARSLPIRQTFDKGRYVARLDRAHLDLQDGLASIRLLGHGTMASDDAASPVEADLELQTHIDVVDFRPDVGTLRAALAVTAVHVIRAGGKGRNGMLWNPVARYFSG